MSTPYIPYAFPVGYHPEGNTADQQGMTLRQWYAGMAMQGCLASRTGFLVDCGTDNVAGWAFRVADQMLAFEQNEKEEAARDRGTEGEK